MKMSKIINIVYVLLLLMTIQCSIASTASAREVTIMVIVINGIESGEAEWQPVINFIQREIVEHTFRLVCFIPNDLERIKTLIAKGEIDFIITQPAIYVDLELNYGVTKILTLEKQKGVAEFGSVLITRVDSMVKTVEDIRNKKIAGVAPLGFGGWLLGYNEMLEYGIDAYQEAREVTFLGSQDKVVEAVLEGDVDLGVIRTGVLENLFSSNKLIPADLRVINEKKHDNFSQLVSTKLYPEWAFARTKQASNNLATSVAKTLLDLPPGGDEAAQAHFWRWVIPYDYQPVHNVMKFLRVGPYQNYGRMTFANFVGQHKLVVTVLFVLSLTILVMLVVIFQSNKILLREKEAKEKALEAMKHLASHDSLTQLPNRRLFYELLGQVLKKSRREGSTTAVLFLDLDGFKKVNDGCGHDAGDKLLINTANTIITCLRESDILARLGGDEFVVVLPEINSRENATNVIEKIHMAVSCLPPPSDKRVKIAVSIGALICGPGQIDSDEIVKQADVLMYEAKKRGKGRYVIGDLKNKSPI